MDKIKKNKVTIQNVKLEVSECKENIQQKMGKVRDIDQENEKLKGEVSRIEAER